MIAELLALQRKGGVVFLLKRVCTHRFIDVISTLLSLAVFYLRTRAS